MSFWYSGFSSRTGGFNGIAVLMIGFLAVACAQPMPDSLTDLSTSSSGANTIPTNQMAVAPLIISNLQSRSVTAGQSLVAGDFCVSATGVSLSYQWFLGASVLAGGPNSNCLILNNLQVTQSGQYKVRVISTVGVSTAFVDSQVATLTVTASGGGGGGAASQPVITSDLPDKTVAAGQNLAGGDFCVTATGDSLSYQWYFGGNPLANGGNSRCLTINNVQVSNQGQYFVKITNTVGTSTAYINSRAATLTVTDPPAMIKVIGVDVFEGCNPYCGYSSSEGDYVITATLNAKTNKVSGQIYHACRYPGTCGAEIFNSSFEFDYASPLMQLTFSSVNGGAMDVAQYYNGCVSIFRSYFNLSQTACFADATAQPASGDIAPVTIKGLSEGVVRGAMSDPLSTVPGAGLCVIAGGTNLHYEWVENGVVLAGQSGHCFQNDGVSHYSSSLSVRVYNAAGSVTSSINQFSIYPDPAPDFGGGG